MSGQRNTVASDHVASGEWCNGMPVVVKGGFLKMLLDEDYFLDISRDVCPMTFVKTRLALEKVAVGTTLMVRFSRGEPLENLPRALGELGHSILSVALEVADSPESTYLMAVRRER
jgi:TusA-related sulfurtransferase